MDAAARESLRERTEAKLKDQHLLDDILQHVTSGGSLIELCKTWDVQYYRINQWLYANHKKEYEAALVARGEWMVQRILDELKAIGTVDIRKAYDENGKLKSPHELPDELACVIASVEVEELFEGRGEEREQIGYLKKVKLWDKLRALELMGKNLKMFIDRHEHTGKVTLEELVGGSMKEPAPPVPPSSALPPGASL